MPVYNYECLKCKKIYEQRFSYTQKEKPICPFCKNKTAKKVITAAPRVIYIGDGFTKNS